MSEKRPDGFLFFPDFLSGDELAKVTAAVQGLEFENIRLRGVVGRRRTAEFGFHYAFQWNRLRPARELPAALELVRAKAATLIGIEPQEFAQTLVNEYAPGVGIGWHCDAPQFGVVCGVSLGAAWRIRFRRGGPGDWETMEVGLPAGSTYFLTGAAKTEWQHTIPPVRERRWSITFRTLLTSG